MNPRLCVGLIRISFMHTRGGMLATKAMVRPRSSGCSILACSSSLGTTGREAAGAQAVDAFVHVEGMGQRQHRMLGRGVGRARHFRDVAAGPGGDIDDATVLLLAPRRQDR